MEDTTDLGLPLPHPQEASIRALNEQRIGRRRAAEATAAQFAQTGFEELGQRGPDRQVGGQFAGLLDVPDRQPLQDIGMGEAELAAFIDAFSVDPRQTTLSTFQRTIQGPERFFADGPNFGK